MHRFVYSVHRWNVRLRFTIPTLTSRAMSALTSSERWSENQQSIRRSCMSLKLWHFQDWKPVLTINSIVYGLQYLFLVSLITSSWCSEFLCSEAASLEDVFVILCNFSCDRNQTLRIRWTRRLLWSCRRTGECSSKMSRRPWKVNLVWYVSRYLCSLVNVRWLIYLPYTGGTLNGVYFERCLKWFHLRFLVQGLNV